MEYYIQRLVDVLRPLQQHQRRGVIDSAMRILSEEQLTARTRSRKEYIKWRSSLSQRVQTVLIRMEDEGVSDNEHFNFSTKQTYDLVDIRKPFTLETIAFIGADAFLMERNFGDKCLGELIESLEEYGLAKAFKAQPSFWERFQKCHQQHSPPNSQSDHARSDDNTDGA